MQKLLMYEQCVISSELLHKRKMANFNKNNTLKRYPREK